MCRPRWVIFYVAHFMGDSHHQSVRRLMGFVADANMVAPILEIVVSVETLRAQNNENHVVSVRQLPAPEGWRCQEEIVGPFHHRWRNVH